MQIIEECCSPLLVDTITPSEAETLASSFKALSDPVRLRLLSLIANTPDGEVCVCNLIEPVARSQPTVSHHLSILVKSGLIEREQRGKWAWYKVNAESVEMLRTALSGRLPITA
jgi:ArsR family transcriptional regulator, arsenate/arsenite/antimonite-responsive transcriptional repressor